MKSLSRRGLLGSGVALAALRTSTALDARERNSRQAADEQADPPLYGRTPHTRFAVNVEMWWRGLPFLDRIRQAVAFGFPAVEFWPWRNKDLDALVALRDELGFEVAQFTAWGFSPGLNDPANHEAFEQEIADSLAVAKRIGARKMTVVGGNDQPGMSPAEMHANIISGLKRVAAQAEAADVMLILEPMNGRVDHPGHCLYGSPDALRICREVGSSHVKINWDLYHMQISEGDLCGRLRDGIDQLGYLQLADHPGRNEPGTGEVNYARVLREAHELGYHDYVGLECSPATDELTAARNVHLADSW